MMQSTLNNAWDLRGLLAESSLYEIYEGVERETGTPVAVKIMREDVAANPERVRLFTAEVTAFARITHPGVAQVFDVDMAGSRPFAVRELVRGVDLRTWGSTGQPTFTALNRAVQDLGAVLQHAFHEGIDCRTVKLSNVIRQEDGALKVLTFSLPRLRLVGESPAVDRNSSLQSDLFFLGTTLFEFVTGDSMSRRRGGIKENWDDLLRESVRVRFSHLPPNALEKTVDLVGRTVTREYGRRFADHTAFLIALTDLIHLTEGFEKQAGPAVAPLSTASAVVEAIHGRSGQSGVPGAAAALGGAPAPIPIAVGLKASGAVPGNLPGTGAPQVVAPAKVVKPAGRSLTPLASGDPGSIGTAASNPVTGQTTNAPGRPAVTAPRAEVGRPVPGSPEAQAQMAALSQKIQGLKEKRLAMAGALPVRGSDGGARHGTVTTLGNNALALASDEDAEDAARAGEDGDAEGSPRFGRPILRIIQGGKDACRSIIWRAADETIWYKNPLVLMSGALLFMICLILFW